MRNNKFEVADVINNFISDVDNSTTTNHQKRTLEAIKNCRTAALGGHIDKCDTCHHLRISYNSCRNRHCPKCQGINKEMWVIQQQDMLLPVAYFHVVFTLPHELNGLCMHNPNFMYDLLFKAAWHTINTLSSDKQWLGAKTSATMVLHTWSQSLALHPHVHCIVPNGGLDNLGNWQFPKKGNGNFLFPVASMKKLFRGFFLDLLTTALKNKSLILPPCFPIGIHFLNWKNSLYTKDWVVFTKKPFSGVQCVIDYLARYSHRVAITNHRILSIDNSNVSFSYKDYKDNAKSKVMILKGCEFLRRFCLHILPLYFRKVRQYGLLSNATKSKDIAAARKALKVVHTILLTKAQRKQIAIHNIFKGKKIDCCSKCKTGKYILFDVITANKDPPIFIASNKIKK